MMMMMMASEDEDDAEGEGREREQNDTKANGNQVSEIESVIPLFSSFLPPVSSFPYDEESSTKIPFVTKILL